MPDCCLAAFILYLTVGGYMPDCCLAAFILYLTGWLYARVLPCGFHLLSNRVVICQIAALRLSSFIQPGGYMPDCCLAAFILYLTGWLYARLLPCGFHPLSNRGSAIKSSIWDQYKGFNRPKAEKTPQILNYPFLSWVVTLDCCLAAFIL
jgi:hypothetical protein